MMTTRPTTATVFLFLFTITIAVMAPPPATAVLPVVPGSSGLVDTWVVDEYVYAVAVDGSIAYLGGLRHDRPPHLFKA